MATLVKPSKNGKAPKPKSIEREAKEHALTLPMPAAATNGTAAHRGPRGDYDGPLRARLRRLGDLPGVPAHVMLIAADLVAAIYLTDDEREEAEQILATYEPKPAASTGDEAAPAETQELSRNNGNAMASFRDALRANRPVPADVAGAVETGQYVALDCERLQPHPDNRRCDPKDPALVELAESIKADGQVQAIVVRPTPQATREVAVKGRTWKEFEIIVGERRWRACQAAGVTVRAQVRTDVDDALALRLIAIENAKRQDLNPIERARLIERLCRPIAEGGSGLTLAAAAVDVGLKDPASASNVRRLLELPQVWQERVAAGELPESFARLLLPYCVAPPLMAVIDVDYVRRHKPKARDWERERWESRSSLEHHLRSVASEWARPIDGQRAVTGYDYKQTGTYRSEPRLFKLTDEVRQTLDVVTIPLDGKPCEVAANTKAFDKLQLPLVKAKHKPPAAAGKRKAASGKPGTKEPTAKQVEREREKAREERADKIGVWRHNWLMAEVNDAIAAGGSGPGQRLLVYLAAQGIDDFIGDETEGALRELAKRHQIDAPRGKRDFTHSGNTQLWALIQALPAETLNDAMRAILRGVLLSPARHIGSAPLATPIVEDLAREANVDLATAWRDLQSDRNVKGSRFVQFLDLWPGEWLNELGDECGMYLANARGRAAKLKLLLSKCPNLPLPKSIAPLAAEPAKRTKGAKAKR